MGGNCPKRMGMGSNMKITNPKTEDITRLEIIDEKGRAYTRWNCKIELSYQDGGRTLKIFVGPRGEK